MRRADREVTDPTVLRSWLAGADCCHLAMVDQGAPYLVTLNYGFEWEGELPFLWFHCAREGRKLDVLRVAPRVCWSIDLGHELVLGTASDHCTMRYQSLVGTGTVVEVTDQGEKKRGLDRIMAQYSKKTEFTYPPAVFDQTTVLRLAVDQMTGKQRT